MPMWPSLTDARISRSENAQAEQATAIALAVAEHLRRELERLVQENLSLKAEIAHLTDDNEDLRGSARIWQRLYEGHLARADRAVSELDAVTRASLT
jgi:exonuclease I